MHLRSAITLRSEGAGRRRHRYWLAALAAPAAITTMITVAGPAATASAAPRVSAAAASAKPQGSPQPQTPHVKIRLTRSRSYCAAIKNDVTQAGIPVWLYKCSKAKGSTWVEVGGLFCGTSGQQICTEFLDAKDMNLCLAMDGARKVFLQGCGQNGNNPPNQSLWITDTGPEKGWRDFAWGGNGDLAVLKVKDKQRLIGVDASAGCGGCWYHWTDS